MKDQGHCHTHDLCSREQRGLKTLGPLRNSRMTSILETEFGTVLDPSLYTGVSIS